MIDEKHSVYCLYCYSLGQTYLLPSVAVSNIIPFTELDTQGAGGCLMGRIMFKGIEIPIIHLGLDAHEMHVTCLSHIMLFKCLHNSKQYLLGAVVGQTPRPINIHPRDLIFKGEKDRCFYPVSGKYLEGYIVDLTEFGFWLEKTGFKLF